MMNWTHTLAASPVANGGGTPSGWGGHMPYMPFGGLPMLLIMGAFVVFIVLMLRGRNSGAGESPMDILKRRYANGEIDKDQFERMKKELNE